MLFYLIGASNYIIWLEKKCTSLLNWVVPIDTTTLMIGSPNADITGCQINNWTLDSLIISIYKSCKFRNAYELHYTL